MDRYEILLQQLSKDNLMLSSQIITEPNRYSPMRKTMDILDGALRNKNVRKIVIRKLTDYKEGDIF